MKHDTPKIVADGPERFRQSKTYQFTRAQLLAEARQRCANVLESGSLFRRILVNLQIEREVRARLRERFPPGALHVIDAKLIKPNQSPEPTPTNAASSAQESLLRP